MSSHLFVSSPRARRLTAFCVAVFVSLTLLIVATAANRGATAAPLFEPIVLEWPTRELPSDWRWERAGVEYKHMYRKGAAGSPRLDWIRNGRR